MKEPKQKRKQHKWQGLKEDNQQKIKTMAKKKEIEEIESFDIPVSLPQENTSDISISKKEETLADTLRTFKTKGYNNNQIAALFRITKQEVDSYDI